MAYDDDFKSGETVEVGPREGTKRPNDDRKARIEANNASRAKAKRNQTRRYQVKVPTDSGGSGTGTVTTTKQLAKTEAKTAQLGRARVVDPLIKKFAEEVQKRFDKYEDKSRYEIEQDDDGNSKSF